MELGFDAADGTACAQDRSLERPFVIFVALWGARFRDYFLELCLPTLLAPGNLPAIKTRQRSKLVIATRPEDWEFMQGTAILGRSRRYIDPVFIEIPPCPAGRSGREHMGLGHKLACQFALREKAYAMLVTPDCVVSDGTLARLQLLAQNGIELVLSIALRLGEEPVLENLKRLGAAMDRRRRDTGEPLALTGRQLAHAAINGFHSESLRFEWDTPLFPVDPSAAWWRVPGEDGVVLHGLSWAPMMFDMAAVQTHDTSSLENWTIDGDYIARNFSNLRSIHVVQDSDEMFYSGLTPMAESAWMLRPNWLYRLPVIGELAKGALFRSCFYSDTYDDLKRRIFFLPVRWHARPLNANWKATERRAAAVLDRYVGPPGSPGLPSWSPFLLVLTALALPQRAAIAASDLLHYRMAIARRFGQALRGDRHALRRIGWRARMVLMRLFGRVTHSQGPKPPCS